MSRVFLPSEIKHRGKLAMRGRFSTALGATMIPLVIITALSLCVLFVPAVRESMELIITGSFESPEAQQEYIMDIYSKILYTTSLVLALFNFLIIGGEKVCLDIVRGKKTSAKKVFGFYEKWYVAMIWPLLTFLTGFGADLLIKYMNSINVNSFIIELFLFHYELLVLLITFKTLFISTALADNECKSFFSAFKTSWKMTNFKTIWSLFLLYMSFMGWIVLVAFTIFPIIYVYPYLRMCVASLYQSVKELQSQ